MYSTVHIYCKVTFPLCSEAQTPLRPFKKLNQLSQFLENDRKVLRFSGVWHDGLDQRKLSLLYYLAGKYFQLNASYYQYQRDFFSRDIVTRFSTLGFFSLKHPFWAPD
jgi:hypothetical protein